MTGTLPKDTGNSKEEPSTVNTVDTTIYVIGFILVGLGLWWLYRKMKSKKKGEEKIDSK